MDSEQIQALYQLGGAVAVVIGGSIFGIRWVVATVSTMKANTVETKKTTIITGDTVAMDRLAGTLEASNVILTENNVLRREEHKDREEMREAIEANTRCLEHVTAQIVEARRDIKDLSFQMARVTK